MIKPFRAVMVSCAMLALIAAGVALGAFLRAYGAPGGTAAVADSLLCPSQYSTAEEAAAAFGTFSNNYYANHPVWRTAGIDTQIKLQWFQFPSGTTFNGKIFGTPKVCSVFKAKEVILSPLSAKVDPSGFEPLTSSLQMRRSTN